MENGSLGAEAASDEFVRRANTVNFLDSGQDLKGAGIKVNAGADGGEDGLPNSGRAMNREAEPDQMFDYLLDLLISRGFLHGNNHDVDPCAMVSTLEAG